jgi:hypothetical protein
MRTFVIALVFIIPLATQGHTQASDGCRPVAVASSYYYLLAEPVELDVEDPSFETLPVAFMANAPEAAAFSVSIDGGRARKAGKNHLSIYKLHLAFLI